MIAQICKMQDCEEYETPERCYITEVANDRADTELSVAVARVEPGITTAWHYLKDTKERYLIISGTGIMEIDDLPPQTVRKGDVVRIPAGCRQRITNPGNEDLQFFAVCTPPFVNSCYCSEE